jgi:hypothetical protein
LLWKRIASRRLIIRQDREKKERKTGLSIDTYYNGFCQKLAVPLPFRNRVSDMCIQLTLRRSADE